MARTIHRLSGRLWRLACERRQHGQSHVFPGRPRRARPDGMSENKVSPAGRPCWLTLPRKHTPGSRKPPTSRDSARKRFAGSASTRSSAWIWLLWKFSTSGIWKRVTGHFSWSAPPEPSAQARWIRCRIWRPSARSATCGSMWMAHTGPSPPGSKGAPADLMGLTAADSVAVDPHKWLYAPLEAGCALVRDPAALRNAFSYHPPYYSFGVEATELL